MWLSHSRRRHHTGMPCAYAAKHPYTPSTDTSLIAMPLSCHQQQGGHKSRHGRGQALCLCNSWQAAHCRLKQLLFVKESVMGRTPPLIIAKRANKTVSHVRHSTILDGCKSQPSNYATVQPTKCKSGSMSHNVNVGLKNAESSACSSTYPGRFVRSYHCIAFQPMKPNAAIDSKHSRVTPAACQADILAACFVCWSSLLGRYCSNDRCGTWCEAACGAAAAEVCTGSRTLLLLLLPLTVACCICSRTPCNCSLTCCQCCCGHDCSNPRLCCCSC